MQCMVCKSDSGRYRICSTQCVRIIGDIKVAGAKRHSQKAEGLARKARSAVVYAVRTGRLIRRACNICGSLGTEAHHCDYSKPLEVEWLCRKHHIQLHRKERYLAGRPRRG